MAKELSVDFTRFLRGVNQLPEKAEVAALRQMVVEAEGVIAESKQEVPVDTGVLRGSGHVQPPQRVPGRAVSVTMGYGGPAAQYALIQHERMDFIHPVGKAKYLEDPLKRRATGMLERVGQAIRMAVSGPAK